MTDNAFAALRTDLQWAIVPATPVRCSDGPVLRPGGRRSALPIQCAFFGHDAVQLPIRRRLAPAAREELKRRLCKRAGRKGNVQAPFFRWRKHDITFEIDVVTLGTECFPLIHKVRLPEAVSAAQLTALTHLPLDPSSLLHDAVCKVLAMVGANAVSARPEGLVDVEVFPLVHIREHAPRDATRSIADDVPWSALASIGTRHERLGDDTQGIVAAYRRKNLCLRDEVAVVDKQSMVVVSEGLSLEVRGFFDASLLALRLQRFLRAATRGSAEDQPEALEVLLERLTVSMEQPAVVTDSVTMHPRWPQILREFQVDQCVAGLRDLLDAERGQRRSLDHTLDRLAALAEQIPDWPFRYDPLGDADGWQALVLARKSLEQVASVMMEHLREGRPSAGGGDNLDARLRALWKPGTLRDKLPAAALPDDIFQIMLFIKDLGNLGAHAGKRVYSPPDRTVALVLGLLVQVLEWFVERFLPAVFRACPACGERVAFYEYFCLCGHAFERPMHQTCACEFLARPGQKHCLRCGSPFVAMGSAEATRPVEWR